MPIIRAGMRKPPPGFDAIADQLDEFEEAMKQAIQDESKGVVGITSKPRGRPEKRCRVEEDAPPCEDGKDDKDGDAEKDAQRGHADQPHEADGEAAEAQSAAKAAPIPPLWRVAQINRDRTRHVFNACFREHRISKEVFDYCCEMNFIDAGLARRWRLPGYEQLCCTACGVPGAASVAANIATKFALRDKQERRGTGEKSGSSPGSDKATCICRVPASQRKNRRFLACAVCGCQGCCSADKVARVAPPPPSEKPL